MLSSSKLILLFLLLLTGLRLAYIGRVELSPDEAYYQMWSERLDWGYYSKGPGVAVAIRAGHGALRRDRVRRALPQSAAGPGHEPRAVRFRAAAVRANVAGWAIIMLNVIPIFQAGSLLMTIDPLSIFFWSAAMATCWLALERAPGAPALLAADGRIASAWASCPSTPTPWNCSASRWRWPVAALAAGVPAGGVLPDADRGGGHRFAAGVLERRARLDHAQPSARPGTSRRGVRQAAQGVHQLPRRRTSGCIRRWCSSALIVAIFLGMAARRFEAAPARPLRGRLPRPALEPDAEKARFLLAFGLPLIVMYTLLAFKTAGEPNWTAPGFVSLSVLAAALWHERAQRSRPAAIYAVAALIVALLFSVLMVDTDLARRCRIAWPYDRDPTARLLGWRSTAQSVATFRQRRGTRPRRARFSDRQPLPTRRRTQFLSARAARAAPRASAGVPAGIAKPGNAVFLLAGVRSGHGGDARAFRRQPAASRHGGGGVPTAWAVSPFVGHSALFITDDERHRNLPDAVESGFEECALVAQYEIRRRGLPLRHVRIYACFNYRGLDL